MATYRMSVLGGEKPDAGVPLDLVSNQITSATAPSIGNLLAYVMADGGADEGLYILFRVPKNYVGSPKIGVIGVLDGTPGASETLGFGFRKRAVADNESADGTFDAEQTVSSTIGSSGSNHADEDQLVTSITLTGGDYDVDDMVYGYIYLDASGTTYAGNFLLTEVFFEYADA